MAAKPLNIAITANASQAKAELNTTATKFEKFGAKVGGFANKVKLPLTIAAAGAVAFGKASVDAASNAQQSLGATEAIFGKWADQAVKSSKKAANSYGLSSNQYRESANLFGALFKNQGIAQDQLAGKTEKFVGLGADLAAMYGGSVTDSVSALTAAFKGEYDQLEKYGVTLKASTVQKRAAQIAEKEYGTELKNLSTEQQTQISNLATQQLLMEQTTDAQGQFSKESDTLAGKQARLNASFDNLKVVIGEKLIPAVTKITDKFIKFAEFAQKHPIVLKLLAIVIGVVLVAAFVAWAASIWAANAALFANPITWVVVAIIALIAVIIVIIVKFDVIKKVVSEAWDKLKQKTGEAVNAMIAWVKKLWTSITTWFTNIKNTIVDSTVEAWTTAKNSTITKATEIINWVKGLPGRIKAALGNLNTLLANAGRDLIQGFIRGIKNKFNDVKNTLGNLTDKIKDWKGPVAVDKKLLTPAGELIIDGLIRGINKKRSDLKHTLQQVTHDIATMGGAQATIGADLTLTPVIAATGGGGGGDVNITVNVPVSANKTEIGREIADALDHYYARGGRR